ncbi:MAG: hypothetical protein ACREVX_07560 [Clostridium sp.]|uniref:hypothetical protein n=1 Tax=Clostridium sp. TaxID=1506 RepID=UPI003D6D5982
MLAYNDKISIIEKYMNTPNVGPRIIANMKINIELNHNLIKNTKKDVPLSWCFIFEN